MMKPPTHLYTPRAAKPARPLRNASSGSSSDGSALKSIAGLSIVLLLLPLGQGSLYAQQAPPPQGWQQNDLSGGQYPPNPQSAYGQPAYGQSQPYAQQPSYPPKGYSQPQSYGQPSYQQQAYPPSNQGYPQQQGYGQEQQGYGQQQPAPQPLNAQQLEQLVAPIALYPDTLVAQVLVAATYPQEIVDTDRWRQGQGYASPDQIAYGADVQGWDPSLKALTAFPQVLAMMDHNLQWTTDLGNAYYNQPQDVLQAVQVMRRRALAAGTLESTPQDAVSYVQGNVELGPVNPQVVYVPNYNPWDVYGQPVAPYPGFSLLGALGSFFGSTPVSYGLGNAMNAFSHVSWGWLGWGVGWLTQSVLFHHASYYSHSTSVADWGLPHGGMRAFSGYGYGSARGQGFARSAGGYAYGGGRGEGISRGYQTSGEAYSRRPANAYSQAYNHVQSPNREQQYGRSGYESGSYRAPAYSSRTNGAYRADRTPAANFQRSNFGARSATGFGNRSFAEPKAARSGGFHMFGGGERAPKGFYRGKSFERGHSGGAHSGGHRGGGKHRL